jgi:hypothetical protein
VEWIPETRNPVTTNGVFPPLTDGKIIPPPIPPENDFAAELQAVIYRQGPQTQGNFRPAEAAGGAGLLLINLVQTQIEDPHFDILGILIVFPVFQSQLGRQHFSDPEAAADPKDAAIKLVAVGKKEGLGLDDGQHIGEKGGQIIAEAQPPGFPAKAGELPGTLGLFRAALSPGAGKAPGGHLGPHLLADILQFIE